MSSALPVRREHQEFLDDHFGVSPQWKSFHRNLRKPEFGDAVRQDTRSDRKLKRFTKMVGMRQQSKQPGLKASGDTGKTYRIKYHPEAKRFSCSCNDWTYKRSVKNRGAGGECKHINRMKDSMKQTLMKTGSLLGIARIARGVGQEEKTRDSAKKAKITQEAYKRNFPRPSLAEEWFFGKKAAAVRGRSASALREELIRLLSMPAGNRLKTQPSSSNETTHQD